MHSYKILNSGHDRTVSRDDGWGIPADMGNRLTRLFIYEWMQGAPCVNQNGQPRPYTAARLAQLGGNLEPVLTNPEGP